MGVSRTMPISTGLQLVATTLFGVIVFHEWSTTISVVLGVLALVCIIIGVILTSLQSEEEKSAEQAGNFKKRHYHFIDFNSRLFSLCSSD